MVQTSVDTLRNFLPKTLVQQKIALATALKHAASQFKVKGSNPAFTLGQNIHACHQVVVACSIQHSNS
jgi:hypothetical protein